MSAVQDADLIIVLEGGRIVQRGTHAHLVAEKGLYSELWKRQQLEEEIKAL
jgi:ATP-binding cassette subfamily B protein